MITVRDLATVLNITAEELLDPDLREFAAEVNSLTAILEARLTVLGDGDA